MKILCFEGCAALGARLYQGSPEGPVASAFAHPIKPLAGVYPTRKLSYILSVIPLLLFVDLAYAGEKEDVAATMDAMRAAWNAGDVDACIKHIAAENSGAYPGNGGLLSQPDWEGARAAFAAGLKVKLQPVHTKVRVYGEAAILTEYIILQKTLPDGTRINATERRTFVFNKQKGQWKAVHAHVSHLTPPNPE